MYQTPPRTNVAMPATRTASQLTDSRLRCMRDSGRRTGRGLTRMNADRNGPRTNMGDTDWKDEKGLRAGLLPPCSFGILPCFSEAFRDRSAGLSHHSAPLRRLRLLRV